MEYWKFLGASVDSPEVLDCFEKLETLRRPQIEEEDSYQYYDWVLVKKKGIELGFVDGPYFRGEILSSQREENFILNQVTFYNKREEINPFEGVMPFGILFSDSRDSVRRKIKLPVSDFRSYLTDCWDFDGKRLVVAYEDHDRHVGSVHIKEVVKPFDDSRRIDLLNYVNWLKYFGLTAEDEKLKAATAPLDLLGKIKEDGDRREVSFINESGVSFYFDSPRGVNKNKSAKNKKELVFSAIKFYRDRDQDARQYNGPLPFGVKFNDSPDIFFEKIKHSPLRKTEHALTGSALWHFDTFSMSILYSTVENFIFRVMVMAPGYWKDISDVSD